MDVSDKLYMYCIQQRSDEKKPFCKFTRWKKLLLSFHFQNFVHINFPAAFQGDACFIDEKVCMNDYYNTISIYVSMNTGLRNRRSDRLPERSRGFDYDDNKKDPLSKGTSKRLINRALPPAILCFILVILFCIKTVPPYSMNRYMDRSKIKPRSVAFIGDNLQRLDLSLVQVKMKRMRRRNVVLAAPRYDGDDSDDDESDEEIDCIPLANWQTFIFPTCNKLHEYNLPRDGRYVNSGYNRDVWGIKDDKESIALKTLAMRHPFIPYMINLQRIDALISERTTASKYIVNVHAYCKYFNIHFISISWYYFSHNSQRWCISYQ